MLFFCPIYYPNETSPGSTVGTEWQDTARGQYGDACMSRVTGLAQGVRALAAEPKVKEAFAG